MIVQDNAASSSSGSNLKSLLIEMGFSSTLVQKSIDENGIQTFPIKFLWKANFNLGEILIYEAAISHFQVKMILNRW